MVLVFFIRSIFHLFLLLIIVLASDGIGKRKVLGPVTAGDMVPFIKIDHYHIFRANLASVASAVKSEQKYTTRFFLYI